MAMRVVVSGSLALLFAASGLTSGHATCGVPASPTAPPKLDFKKISASVFKVVAGDSVGTGFLFGNGTTVATCLHVVKGGGKIRVLGSGKAEWQVVGLRIRPESDVALLTLDKPSSRAALQPAASSPQIGDRLYVIGNRLGFLTNSLSDGIVSALRSQKDVGLVQFTAPISPGSSGSPVINVQGEVIGRLSVPRRTGPEFVLQPERRCPERGDAPLIALFPLPLDEGP